ncbi:hypothetical protein BCR44DRAFT_1435268 [Catenaria anguillulae PL171]|uniref:Uncharacterized protein n=1 Tax=Catenaria anguillulae PL171 TaxID=765915 RepID=A0A1Y2HJU2_9FUNG|nr:hypothetical protein BCR44DRAFT_1435268 [Catenaria anguillulae PL171]
MTGLWDADVLSEVISGVMIVLDGPAAAAPPVPETLATIDAPTATIPLLSLPEDPDDDSHVKAVDVAAVVLEAIDDILLVDLRLLLLQGHPGSNPASGRDQGRGRTRSSLGHKSHGAIGHSERIPLAHFGARVDAVADDQRQNGLACGVGRFDRSRRRLALAGGRGRGRRRAGRGGLAA